MIWWLHRLCSPRAVPGTCGGLGAAVGRRWGPAAPQCWGSPWVPVLQRSQEGDGVEVGARVGVEPGLRCAVLAD